MREVIVTPRLTEKSYQLATEGIYVFDVSLFANKNQIKQAVAEQYDVTVKNVSIVRKDGKKKSYNRGKNRYPGVRYQSDTKKAYVRLKDGDKIAVFEPEQAKQEEESK